MPLAQRPALGPAPEHPRPMDQSERYGGDGNVRFRPGSRRATHSNLSSFKVPATRFQTHQAPRRCRADRLVLAPIGAEPAFCHHHRLAPDQRQANPIGSPFHAPTQKIGSRSRSHARGRARVPPRQWPF